MAAAGAGGAVGDERLVAELADGAVQVQEQPPSTTTPPPIPVPSVMPTMLRQPLPAPSSSSASVNARASLISPTGRLERLRERLDDRDVLPAGEVGEEDRPAGLEIERSRDADPHAGDGRVQGDRLAAEVGDALERAVRAQVGMGRRLPFGNDLRHARQVEDDPLDVRAADVDPQRAHRGTVAPARLPAGVWAYDAGMAIHAVGAAEELRRSEVAATSGESVRSRSCAGFPAPRRSDRPRAARRRLPRDRVHGRQRGRARGDRPLAGRGPLARRAPARCARSTRSAAAVEAGAQFLVAPTYQPDVVERALELGGAGRSRRASPPREIDTAWQQGATFVKLFPGGAVGATYLRAVLAPLADVEIVVTGGVDATTARAFLDAGAVGVGVSTAQLGQPADRGRRLRRRRARGAHAARRRRLTERRPPGARGDPDPVSALRPVVD